jgi:hypothetical protein
MVRDASLRDAPQYEADLDYFFDGQGAPQGAQAPAKSSGETARPLDGLTRWLPTIAARESKTTTI